MFFAHLPNSRRCLMAGALGGVVMEFCLVGAFLWPHGEPNPALSAGRQRMFEVMPVLVLGGLALAASAIAFALAGYFAWQESRRPKRKPPSALRATSSANGGSRKGKRRTKRRAA